MIGLYNKDSSFFTVQLLNTKGPDLIRQQDVLSLQVTEEMDKITMGTLRLYDPALAYSRILREGVEVGLSWGYKKLGVDVREFGSDLFSDLQDRRGFKAIVQNPSGGGDSRGALTFNCSFVCLDWRGLQDHIVHSGGTKATVVQRAMARIGVTLLDVRFKMGSDIVGGDTSVRQYETDFHFLSRLAREWRAVFRIGYSPEGVLCGVFIDQDFLATSSVAKRMCGGGLTLNFNAGEKSNVVEYSWQCHAGENGAGDNVQMEMVNGEIVFRRFTIENEKVRTWKLNTKRIEEEFNSREKTGGMAGQWQLVREVMDARDFEQVKRFFDPVDTTTAPNGLGYSVNAKVLGNPAAIPPAIVDFQEGFPDRLRKGTGRNTTFYLRKASHSIDQSGYFTDLEVVDVYLISPTGQLL